MDQPVPFVPRVFWCLTYAYFVLIRPTEDQQGVLHVPITTISLPANNVPIPTSLVPLGYANPVHPFQGHCDVLIRTPQPNAKMTSIRPSH